jgi:hypothetical protein
MGPWAFFYYSCGGRLTGGSPAHYGLFFLALTLLIEQFESLADPRVRQPEHLLLDIVAIAILAVIAGADDMVAVETYGKAKAAWLKTFLALPNGIPSHDTFSRVLALIEPNSLQECFLRWVKQLTEQLAINLINIDGKTARGSYDRESSLKALHTVSAWSCEHHLVLAPG